MNSIEGLKMIAFTKSPNKENIRLFLRGIEQQVPDMPEARLCFAIFKTAVDDAFSNSKDNEPRGAQEYLSGDIPHLEMVGINADWVRRKMVECRLVEKSK